MKKLADFIARILNTGFGKIIAAKYPRLFKFIAERLSLNKFIGLPLTLLFVVFTANLLVFNEIAESIENSRWMLAIDNLFAQFLFSIRTNQVANSFFYFSKVGSLRVVIAVGSIAALVLLFQRKFIYVVALLISLAGSGITILLGKLYFHRVRPDGLSFYNETTYSFPSGHALIAVSFYGLLFYFIIRHSINYKLRWTIFSILFILFLGYSRLYLCVHYLSDVFAGYSLGFLWFLLAVSVVEWKFTRVVE
jgi:undecaprenyl-diphosphatase